MGKALLHRSFAWLKGLTWEKIALPMVFLLFVLARAMDRVFAKRVGDRMANYSLMYWNIIWPIGIQLGTLVIAAFYVLFKRYISRDKRYGWGFFWPRGEVASAKGAYSQWKLATFSIGDQLNATITGLANPYLSVTMQGILSNFAILWTALFSAIWLGARYHQTHFIGCLLVVISSFVAVACLVESGDIATYIGPNNQVYTSSALWYLIFIIGTVPNGFSNVWKQYCLKSVDLDIMYATTWSGFWQVLWGFLFFPIQWIPLPPPAEVTTPQELPSYLANSITCFFGTAPSESQLDQACAAEGGSAALWFMVYVVFNLFFNVLLLWLTKRMSALWASIATVLCLDLASLFSMSPALMGNEATPLSFSDYLGLVTAGIAMWAYCLMPEVDKHGNKVAGVDKDVKRLSDDPLQLPTTMSKSLRPGSLTACSYLTDGCKDEAVASDGPDGMASNDEAPMQYIAEIAL